METKGLLPYLKDNATYSYTKQDETSSRPPIVIVSIYT